MTKNSCLKFIRFVLITLLPGVFINVSVSGQSKQPNIIFILADDMGYGDVSGLNENAKTFTPNIDQLIKSGISFSDAHTASAVCTPSRYAILTGRYAWRSPLKKTVLWEYDPPLIAENRLTLGNMLKERGYATACIGKWHLGWDWKLKNGAFWKDSLHIGSDKNDRARLEKLIDFTAKIENGPVTRGFDYYFGVDVPNFPPYCYFENDHLTFQPDTIKPAGMYGNAGVMKKDWSLEAVMPELTVRAVEYVNKMTKSKQPFFLYFPLTAPHTPIAPTDAFKGKSKAGLYGDFIQQVDWTVGEIMKALEENGIAENTIIVFTSDNGSPAMDGTGMGGGKNSVNRFGHFPSYIFSGIKADILEGGHRVPFVVRWPAKIKAGSKSDRTVCLADWMATCADILDVQLPANAGEDSYSLLPLLLNKGKYERSYTIHHSIAGYFAIRKGDWKLIMGAGTGGWTAPVPGKEEEGLPPIQLYNLKTDIKEKHNVEKTHPQVVKELKQQLVKCINDGRSNKGPKQKNEGTFLPHTLSWMKL